MKLFTKNLYVKLVFYLLLVGLVCSGLLYETFAHLEFNRANAKNEATINHLINSVIVDASIAVYANNRVIAKQVIDALLEYDTVYKVQILSDQGLSMERTRADDSAAQQKPIVRDILAPFGDKKSLGQISIMPSANANQTVAKNHALLYVTGALVQTLLLLFAMLLGIRLLFSKPLFKLSHTLRDVIAGELERVDLLEANNNNELGGLVANINKILDELNTKLSTQHALRKRIESVEKKLRNIFESTSAGLFLLDKYGNVLTSTPTLLRLLGYEDTGLISINGQNFADLFFKEPKLFKNMLKNALESEQLETGDLRISNDTEHNQIWVHCLVSKIIDSTGEINFEGVILDISKRIAKEKAMQYEANYDALTGLLRRNAGELKFKKHLTSPLSASTIVMLLDLDGFKKANDTYEHDAGDMVLIETARRLERCVRHEDILCRLGGDEFLIVLASCSPVTVSFTIAEKIIKTIREPIVIGKNINVNIGVSIGLSVFPVHGTTVETLMKSADEAMYEVKRKGKNGYGIKGKDGSIKVQQPYFKRQ